MNVYMVGWSLTTMHGKAVAGGVRKITGNTLDEAQQVAAIQIRNQYECPRGVVTFRNAVEVID